MRLNISQTLMALSKCGLAFLIFASASSSARANPVMFVLNIQSSQLLLATLGPESVCTTFAYDVNGNRTSQAVTTAEAAPRTWGAAMFGCFVWGQ